MTAAYSSTHRERVERVPWSLSPRELLAIVVMSECMIFREDAITSVQGTSHGCFTRCFLLEDFQKERVFVRLQYKIFRIVLARIVVGAHY